MFDLVSLDQQLTVKMYLDGPKRMDLKKSTCRQISASLRKLWPQMVTDCVEDGIEGPICGVITCSFSQMRDKWTDIIPRNLKHLSPGQWHRRDLHSTIRLFDRYNHEIGTYHAPMPEGHEEQAWYTVSADEQRNRLDFKSIFEEGMTVHLYPGLR